jgi:glycosyltransferase involved in cell wall biosynthesis
MIGIEQLDVGILCVTCNQAQYISQAIDSFVTQLTKFTFKIFIIDDASTDETEKIINELIGIHPGLIKYTRNAENIGLISSYVKGLEFLTAKYIAYCDGDDFWTDPLKLEKQVTYMEENPEVILTHHKDVLLDERGIDYSVYSTVVDSPNLFQVYDTHFISSPSIVCRNIFTSDHLTMMKFAGSGDIAIFALAAVMGKIDYINESMACYRLAKGAQTSNFYSNARREICNINYVMLLNNTYGCRFDNQLLQKLVLVLNKHSHALSRLSVYQRFKIKVKNAILLYGNIPTSPLRRAQLLFNYIIN